MSEHQTLSAKQRKALEALLLTGDIAGAAAAVPVARDTLYRWMKQPVFLQAIREAEAASIDELSRVLIRLGRSAAGTLAAAMADKQAPLGPRIRAADIALSRLLQLRELATIETRMTELERLAGLEKSG